MKIKSKKIIGFLMAATSVLGGYAFASAQSAYIVPNQNNQYYFSDSSYGRGYYANNQGYNYNYYSPCYGLKACYSANYLKPSYHRHYTTWYPVYNASYDNNYNNNYQYPTNYNYYNNYDYNNNYNSNYNYQNYSNYSYSTPVSVYSVPQEDWTRGNYNYNNYSY